MRKKLFAQSNEYRIVNDAFIFAVIQFIEGDYAKRLSDEAIAQIIVLKAYYIQFKTFMYLKVASASINPKKLLRYPSDKLVLLEIARQIESTYKRVKRQRRPCWTWPLVIGPY